MFGVFFYGITVRSLTGQSWGFNKAKLEVYSIMVRSYDRLNLYYTSMLRVKFGNLISHSKTTTGITFFRFSVLILKEVYTQEGIQTLCNVDVVEFAQMTIPHNTVDDVMIFQTVAQIHDVMLNLVNPFNKLLIAYWAFMDSNPTSILPPRVTSIGAKGLLKSIKTKEEEEEGANCEI